MFLFNQDHMTLKTLGALESITKINICYTPCTVKELTSVSQSINYIVHGSRELDGPTMVSSRGGVVQHIPSCHLAFFGPTLTVLGILFIIFDNLLALEVPFIG